MSEIKDDETVSYTVYTDDESIIHFDPWDHKENRSSIELIRTQEEMKNPVWIHDIYPNIRYENNVEKMFRGGMFDIGNKKRY